MATWTQSQVDAYNARMHGTARQPVPVDAVEDESELHNNIIEHCKSKGWQYLHGSMAHRTFRTVGECDFVLMASEGRTFYVEVKTKTGKLSVDQQGFIAQARKNGHAVHVVRSFQDFLEVVK